MITREEVRSALTGPAPSVSTPFGRDGAIDYKALRNLIDFIIDAGSKTVLLTHGDSLYSILTDQEIAEVTKLVVQHTAGRAMVVAADHIWWTGKEIEFAKYCRDVGADLLMVLPPDWGHSCTPRTFADHYAAVASHIPVMVVTGAFIPRGAPLALETLKLVRDEVAGVYAVKDDMCGDFARRLALMVHDRWAVYSGGLKENHMNNLPYGCDGYLSTFISFMPQVAWNYWRAIEANDLAKAKEIIRDYEMPYFDFIAKLPGGMDAGIHGTLELFGVAERWRRKPYHSLSDEEMERLKEFFAAKGWL